jgi:hypothetical protein
MKALEKNLIMAAKNGQISFLEMLTHLNVSYQVRNQKDSRFIYPDNLSWGLCIVFPNGPTEKTFWYFVDLKEKYISFENLIKPRSA